MLQTTINNAITIPEDEGTGLEREDADWISAGHIGGLLAQDNLTNHVERGLDFTDVDYNDLECTISRGLSYLYYADRVTVQDERGDYSRNWEEGIGIALTTPQQTISLHADAMNHVYIAADMATNNGASFIVTEGDESAADIDDIDVMLKIGEIDTVAETATELNRAATVSAETITGPVTNGKELRDIEGTGLFIDADGTLTGEITAKDLAPHDHSSEDSGGSTIRPQELAGNLFDGEGATSLLGGGQFAVIDGVFTLVEVPDHDHDGYAAADHSHAEYAAVDHTHNGYAVVDHTHDEYATQSDLDAKADVDHTHDDLGGSDTSVTYVTPSDDFDTVVNGPGEYVLTAGNHVTSQPTILVEGMIIRGLAGATLTPDQDIDLFIFNTQGFDHLTQVRDLEIKLDALLSENEYTSNIFTFHNTDASAARYEGGTPFIQNVVGYGGNAGGTGSTGILLEATGGNGVSWVNTENVRLTHLNYGVREHTDDDADHSWIQGNRVWNIHPLACTYGIYQEMDGGSTAGNVYRLICNGSDSSVEQFIHIEGNQHTLYTHTWDANRNGSPWGFGHISGDRNRIIPEGAIKMVAPYLDDVGQYNDVVTAHRQVRTWEPDPDPPGWLNPSGDNSIGYRWNNQSPTFNLQTDGQGTTASLDAGDSIYSEWHYPQFDGYFATNHTDDLEFFMGLEDQNGSQYGILADSTNARGTDITDNFIAYANGGSGEEYTDTGVTHDNDIHHMRVYMGRIDWNFGIVLDGERHLRYVNDSQPTHGRPIVRLTQHGTSPRNAEVNHLLRFSVDTEQE